MKLQSWLGMNELFRALDPAALKELAKGAEWLELPSGRALFQRGDVSDAVYLVVHGRLRVCEPDGSGDERILGEVSRGEAVGELSVITGEARSANVYAVRDSGLVRVSKQAFDMLLEKHPASMMRMTRLVLTRMNKVPSGQALEARMSTRSIAVMPAHEGVAVDALAQQLAQALAEAGPTMKLDRHRVDAALGGGYAHTPFSFHERNQLLLAWLNGLEGRYRYIVYQAEPEASAWTTRCLRQADRIIVVANAAADPAESALTALLRRSEVRAPVELVLLTDGHSLSGADVYGWRRLCGAEAHHHLHLGNHRLNRLGRLLTGRGLGVVLAGGGARGYAHLGLLRALEERRLSIDLVGGSSMGAFIGALVAIGLPVDDVDRVTRETFVRHNYLNDYTIPRISLIAARKFLQRLFDIFGDRRIEDLALPFFCVSTNITRACQAVHDRGPLAMYLGASMAVPGIAPPIVDDGELLVDGGLINNLPADVMQALGRGRVIGSDVSTEEEMRVENAGSENPVPLNTIDGDVRLPNIFKILFQTVAMTGTEVMERQKRACDVYLRMPVESIGIFDWEKIDTIVERSYEYACRALDDSLANLPPPSSPIGRV